MTATRNHSLLIVDDDPLVAQLISAYVDGCGYEVFSATNGREALKLVEELEPAFVITDWELPELSGLDLCRSIRGLDMPGYTYVVFVTERSGDAELREAMEAGADDFISKPLRKPQLLARLNAGSRIVQLQSHLTQLADEDALTGLLVRRAFKLIALKEWERTLRMRLSLSVALIDIDHFKQVNDTFGHPAGDEVLRKVAQVIKKSIRASDTAARVGGEEMCVLLPETDEASAVVWAERLRERIASTRVSVGSNEIKITVSIGVASVVVDIEEFDQLVQLSDQCLLAAKQLGRNRVVSRCELVELDRSGGETGCRLFDKTTVDSVMIPLIHSLRADWKVEEAAAYLLEYRVSSAPVIDNEGQLAGIVSDKDLLQIGNAPIEGIRVAQVMRTNVICYETNALLSNLLRFMARASIRSVIVTENGKPCGVVSRATLVRWMVDNVWDQADLKLPAASPESFSSAPRKEPLLDVAVALCSEAERLRNFLAQGDIEGQDIAMLIGSASRMQELTTEVLAGSASATKTQGGLSAHAFE